MSEPLVLQLQNLASGSNTQVPELLRKSLIVSTKLRLDEFRAWVRKELGGYEHSDDVPPYRNARTEIRALNPYHGLIPFVIADKQLADAVQNVQICDPISSLIHLLESREDGSGSLHYPLSDQQTTTLMEWQSNPVPLTPVRLIGTGQVTKVIDAVRTQILDWSLDLERNGILGEGLQFTPDEQQLAVENSSINIHNFQGIFGNVHGQNTITQSLKQDIKTGNFQSLAECLREHGVRTSDVSELEEALESDPKPADSKSLGPQTSGWIGKMIAKAAQGTWDISVETASNLLHTAILMYYGIV